MPKKTSRSPRKASSGGKWYLNTLVVAARVLASLAVLLMIYLFWPQLKNLTSRSVNDVVALTLIPILLSAAYLFSWKSLWWSGASALVVLIALLAFMTLKGLEQTLTLEAILFINLPTPLLILGAFITRGSRA